MRRFIIILSSLPCLVHAQAPNVLSTQDMFIKTVLENTVNYIEHRNDIKPDSAFLFHSVKDSINWNDPKFLKWQIIEPKDSLKIN